MSSRREAYALAVPTIENGPSYGPFFSGDQWIPWLSCLAERWRKIVVRLDAAHTSQNPRKPIEYVASAL